jgi:hypothetical protein
MRTMAWFLSTRTLARPSKRPGERMEDLVLESSGISFLLSAHPHSRNLFSRSSDPPPSRYAHTSLHIKPNTSIIVHPFRTPPSPGAGTLRCLPSVHNPQSLSLSTPVPSSQEKERGNGGSKLGGGGNGKGLLMT